MIKKNYKITTSVAILLWSLSAILLSNLKTPPIEGLIITTTFAAIFIAIKITIQNNWQKVLNNKKSIILSGVFLSINNLAYYLSFNYISPTLIDIICWLWPAILIVSHSLIYKKPLNTTTKVSVILSTLAILVINPIKTTSLDIYSFLGIILAFSATASWCLYSLIAKKHNYIPAEFTVISISLSLPILIILHCIFETSIMPNMQDWQILLILSAGPASLAFCCWDYSLKKGPINSITISSCCIPIFSIMILILFDQATFSINLIISIILLLVSNFLVLKSKKI